MSGVVRLRFRLRDRLRFRQTVRLRFPAPGALLAGFPCTRAFFLGDCAADISVSAGKYPVPRPLTGDPVGRACRVAASRRRYFAALARLVKPAAFAVLRCAAVRGCTVQPSLSRRLPGRWCYRPRAARRPGGAR